MLNDASVRLRYDCATDNNSKSNQRSEDALDGHEDHGAGALLRDLAGSVPDGVLRLQGEEEDGGEVVHLGDAWFPAADSLQQELQMFQSGNTKGGSITVLLTPFLTGLD